MAVYHAFHCGKGNQSFRMENENNQTVYEANLTAFRLFTASEFEFSDKIALRTATHRVGKTVSMSEGRAGISMTAASYFKLDGKKCFDVLAEKGYSIQLVLKLDLLHPEFALMDAAGQRVAVYKMNVIGEKEENVFAIGNKQSNTVITTESDDLEGMFLGAFILSRVDFSLYLL